MFYRAAVVAIAAAVALDQVPAVILIQVMNKQIIHPLLQWLEHLIEVMGPLGEEGHLGQEAEVANPWAR